MANVTEPDGKALLEHLTAEATTADVDLGDNQALAGFFRAFVQDYAALNGWDPCDVAIELTAALMLAGRPLEVGGVDEESINTPEGNRS